MSYNNQETTRPSGNANAKPAGVTMLSSTSMVGNKVCNKGLENVGDIKDFMLDTKSGKLEYAVLSFGSFLGMGEKLFAVPYKALTLDTVNKRFILDVEKDRLKAAPGFDKDNWPDMADQAWARNIQTYYGANIQSDKPAAY